MIYLLLTPDEFLASQRIGALKQALGDPEMADLNVAELEGARITGPDLLAQASMMPFLAPRRLLIARDFLHHLDKRMSAAKEGASVTQEAAVFLAGLGDLPDSCDLVLYETNALDRRRPLWKGFDLPAAEKTAGRKVAGLQALIDAQRIVLEAASTPEAKQLPVWIQRHARTKRIAIDGRAIQLLADFIGPSLRQLDSELEKLAAYAGGRPVTAEDVKLLVSDAGEALIWDLTDALSQRNGRQAMHTLYELRRGDDKPFYLLTMIARQYRIMIKVKEALDHGLTNQQEIAKAIGESPYPVKKAMQQVRHHAAEELDAIIGRLLEADYAMKTGADPNATIDILVAELTHKRA